MNDKIKDKINELIDSLETEYGELEGVEVLLTKSKNNEGKIIHSDLKEVNLYFFTKTNILNKQ